MRAASPLLGTPKLHLSTPLLLHAPAPPRPCSSTPLLLHAPAPPRPCSVSVILVNVRAASALPCRSKNTRRNAPSTKLPNPRQNPLPPPLPAISSASNATTPHACTTIFASK